MQKNGLDSACLVVNFRALKGWKQTSISREQSATVAETTGCERQSVAVQVKLFRNDVTEAINALFTETRRALGKFTLPTPNDSQTLVPISQWDKVSTMLDDANARLEVLTSKLATVHAQYLHNEQTRLGSLYDGAKYPTLSQVARGTKFEFSFETLPSANRFAELFTAETIVSKLQAQYETKLATVASVAKSALVERLAVAVDKVVESVRAFHSGAQTRLLANKLIKTLRAEVAQCAALNFDDDITISSELDKVLIAIPANPETLLVQTTAAQFCNALQPVQAAPVAVAPVQAAPVQAAPVQAAPVQAAPVQAAPVAVAPVAVAPVAVAPVAVAYVSIDEFC